MCHAFAAVQSCAGILPSDVQVQLSSTPWIFKIQEKKQQKPKREEMVFTGTERVRNAQ